MKSAAALSALCLLLAFAMTCYSPATAAELDRKFVISTNPILDMFTWFNAELEVAVAGNVTVGVAGNYVTYGDPDDYDEETYMAATLFMRYYPTSSFEGFYFGGRLGFNHVSAQVEDEETADVYVDEEGSFLAAGIDVGYSWLLGDTKKFYVSLGVGAIRLFGEDLEDADISMTLPTVRIINVGIAF